MLAGEMLAEPRATGPDTAEPQPPTAHTADTRTSEPMTAATATTTAATATPTAMVSPVLPSSSPSCVLARIVSELSTTERSYLNSIDCLHTKYIQPLVCDAKLAKELALTDQARDIWSQAQGAIEPMVKLHREVLMDCAEVATFAASPEATPADTVSRVASIFLHRAPYFKMYTAYVDSYLSCLSVLPNMPSSANAPATSLAAADKKKFMRWTEAQSLAIGNGQNLQSLLIMPVQRPPRYELLLSAIDKEYEEDRKRTAAAGTGTGSEGEANATAAHAAALALLTQARAAIKDLNSKLNEWKRASENKQRMWTLSQTLVARGLPPQYNILESHRKYVADAVVTQVHPNPTARKQLHLWLTSDVLILVSSGKSKLKGWIEIADLISVTAHDAQTGELSIHSAKQLEAPEKCLSVESMSSTTATPTSFFATSAAPPVLTATSRRRTFTPQAPRTRTSRFSFFAASPPPAPPAAAATVVANAPQVESSPTSSPWASSPCTSPPNASASATATPSSSSSWVTFEFADGSQRSRWAGLLTGAIEAHAATQTTKEATNGLWKSPRASVMLASPGAATTATHTQDGLLATPIATGEPPLKKQRLTPPEERTTINTTTTTTTTVYSLERGIERYIVPSPVAAAAASRRSIGYYSPESVLPSIPLEESFDDLAAAAAINAAIALNGENDDDAEEDDANDAEDAPLAESAHATRQQRGDLDDSFDLPMAESRPAEKRSPSRSLASELARAGGDAADGAVERGSKPSFVYRASPAAIKQQRRRQSRTTNAFELNRAQAQALASEALRFIAEEQLNGSFLNVTSGSDSGAASAAAAGAGRDSVSPAARRSSRGSKRSSAGDSIQTVDKSETSFADIVLHVDEEDGLDGAQAGRATGEKDPEMMFSPARTHLALAAVPSPIAPIPIEEEEEEHEEKVEESSHVLNANGDGEEDQEQSQKEEKKDQEEEELTPMVTEEAAMPPAFADVPTAPSIPLEDSSIDQMETEVVFADEDGASFTPTLASIPISIGQDPSPAAAVRESDVITAAPGPIAPIPIDDDSTAQQEEEHASSSMEAELVEPIHDGREDSVSAAVAAAGGVDALDAPILTPMVSASVSPILASLCPLPSSPSPSSTSSPEPSSSACAVPALQLTDLVAQLDAPMFVAPTTSSVAPASSKSVSKKPSKKRLPSASPAKTARGGGGGASRSAKKVKEAPVPAAAPKTTSRSLKKVTAPEPKSSLQRTTRSRETVAPATAAAATACGSLSGRKRARSTMAPIAPATGRSVSSTRIPSVPTSSAASNLPLSTPVPVPASSSSSSASTSRLEKSVATAHYLSGTASSRGKRSEKQGGERPSTVVVVAASKRPATAAAGTGGAGRRNKRKAAAPPLTLTVSPSAPALLDEAGTIAGVEPAAEEMVPLLPTTPAAAAPLSEIAPASSLVTLLSVPLDREVALASPTHCPLSPRRSSMQNTTPTTLLSPAKQQQQLTVTTKVPSVVLSSQAGTTAEQSLVKEGPAMVDSRSLDFATDAPTLVAQLAMEGADKENCPCV